MSARTKRGLGKPKTRMAKVIKKLDKKATKAEDKLQNTVLKNLQKDVIKLKGEPERKTWIYYDNFAFGSTITTTFDQSNPFKLILNTPQRGTNSYNRVGDKIKCLGMRFTATVYPTSASSIGIGIDAMVRCMIVRFKNQQGRDLQIVGNALSATNGPPLFYATPGNPVWPQMDFNHGIDGQMDALTEYQIIYDKKVMLTNDVGTTYWNGSAAVKEAVNPEVNFLCNKTLNFNTDLSLSNAGTYADVVSNGLYAVFTTETSTDLTIKLNTKVIFIDN